MEVYTGPRGIEKIDTAAVFLLVLNKKRVMWIYMERARRMRKCGKYFSQYILCKTYTLIHSLVKQHLCNELKAENWYLESNVHWLNMHILIHTYVKLIELCSVLFSFDKE